MKVELELWHLILLLTMFFSTVWAFGSTLMKQFELRLDERFDARDAALSKADGESRRALKELADGQRSLEKDFLEFKATLPDIYTRREDYIRGSAQIEHKVDALAAHISELKTLVMTHERT